MRTTVGAFEAKTHLSTLLERVERGEEIVITRHGRPVARLAPISAEGGSGGDVLARLGALRAGLQLGMDWKRLRAGDRT